MRVLVPEGVRLWEGGFVLIGNISYKLMVDFASLGHAHSVSCAHSLFYHDTGMELSSGFKTGPICVQGLYQKNSTSRMPRLRDDMHGFVLFHSFF